MILDDIYMRLEKCGHLCFQDERLWILNGGEGQVLGFAAGGLAPFVEEAAVA